MLIVTDLLPTYNAKQGFKERSNSPIPRKEL